MNPAQFLSYSTNSVLLSVFLLHCWSVLQSFCTVLW